MIESWPELDTLLEGIKGVEDLPKDSDGEICAICLMDFQDDWGSYEEIVAEHMKCHGLHPQHYEWCTTEICEPCRWCGSW